MNQQINMNILKQADEITLQRIAEEFPIDFGKEDIFERAYHAYLEKSAEPKSPIRRHAVHIAAAAACCILVLSAAYAVGIAPRQIPSIPEESTTETHAAAKPTQETTETTVHTEHTEQTEHTENTEHTNPAETTAPQTTAAASETGTQTQTGVAVVIPTTAETTVLLPATTQPTAATDPTESAVETQTDITEEPMEKPNSTTQPEADATDPTWRTEAPTEKPVIPTESPKTEEPTEEPNEESYRPPYTESPEEPTKPTETTALPTLAGYDVTLENGQLQVVYQNEVLPSPIQLRPYRMKNEQFLIESTTAHESNKDRRKYRILNQETSETFTVYQSRREQFRAACQSDAELIESDVNGSPAFLAIYTAYKEKYCALYWDDGKYTFTVTSTLENRELLLQLAESFRYPIS